MGAGCYYTHDNVEKKCFWIDLDLPEDELEAMFETDAILEDLNHLLTEELGYQDVDQWNYCNGLFNLKLESTYYGDGIQVKLEPFEDSWEVEEQRLANLGRANHEVCYNKIKNKLLERGYHLRIATSGYTSTKIELEAVC